MPKFIMISNIYFDIKYIVPGTQYLFYAIKYLLFPTDYAIEIILPTNRDLILFYRIDQNHYQRTIV